MNSYNLLPFYFDTIAEKEVIVNEVGDMLILPLGTVQTIVKKEVIPNSELYKTLHTNFFITDQVVHPLFEVLISRLAARKKHLFSRASLHIFVLTLRCNQKCYYCQASSQFQGSDKLCMSKESMDNAIDLMFKSNSNHITMEFQGGEPTLEFNLLKYGVKRAYELNNLYKKDLTFVICTNCVNITEEFISLCEKYNIMISSSFDGPKELHDSNRGIIGSYERVVAGFNKVRNSLGQENLSALMTTSELSLNYPQEIIDEYIKNGFSNIFLRPLNPYGKALETKNWGNYTDKFISFYKQALDYIIEINNNGKFFREEYASIILRKMLTSFDGGFVDLQSPSGCIQSVIVYNYDGKVYCSDESRMLAEIGIDEFCLGSLSDEYEKIIYGEKAKRIAMVSSNECIAGCSDCVFKSYCGADPVRNFAMQNDIYGNRPSSLFCKKNKEIISYLIELILTKRESVLPIFRKWLK